MEISQELTVKDLWVCEKKEGLKKEFPILVYFVEPVRYPILECCGKAVYL
jgi:hypothetical protein